MKRSVLLLAIAVMTWSIGIAQAANPMSNEEASPSLKERITQDTIQGTLMKVDGPYNWIKNNDGKEIKIHVDKSTKKDKVAVGDQVKAYVTDQGHTTTLQRAE